MRTEIFEKAIEKRKDKAMIVNRQLFEMINSDLKNGISDSFDNNYTNEITNFYNTFDGFPKGNIDILTIEQKIKVNELCKTTLLYIRGKISDNTELMKHEQEYLEITKNFYTIPNV